VWAAGNETLWGEECLVSSRKPSPSLLWPRDLLCQQQKGGDSIQPADCASAAEAPTAAPSSAKPIRAWYRVPTQIMWAHYRAAKSCGLMF
jgi:hypothetical protein